MLFLFARMESEVLSQPYSGYLEKVRLGDVIYIRQEYFLIGILQAL